MASFVIPTDQWESFQKKLYDDYQIEAPTVRWNNRTLLRISVNAYNTSDELERLAQAIATIVRLACTPRTEPVISRESA